MGNEGAGIKKEGARFQHLLSGSPEEGGSRCYLPATLEVQSPLQPCRAAGAADGEGRQSVGTSCLPATTCLLRMPTPAGKADNSRNKGCGVGKQQGLEGSVPAGPGALLG